MAPGYHIDPFALTGDALMDQVRLTEHAVVRYRQSVSGPSDPKAARDQMRRALGRDARAVRSKPQWAGSSNTADFFLLAGGPDGEEEFCLPISRRSSGSKPFEALTCLHRSVPLFELSPAKLLQHVAYTEDILATFDELCPGVGTPTSRFTTMIAHYGRLLHHPPRGHPRHHDARFYLVAGPVFIPVAWRKGSPVPLLALDVHSTRLPRLRRVIVWLRRRFSLRVT